MFTALIFLLQVIDKRLSYEISSLVFPFFSYAKHWEAQSGNSLDMLAQFHC